MTGRHRPAEPPPPPRFTWLVKPTAVVAAILSVASLGILWHGTWEQAAPVTVAAPTAVDLREPTGHGGPIGPLAGPSFAADVPVWSEDKGPVIVNGQALARVTTATRSAGVPAPTPRPSPTAAATSTSPPTQSAEPTQAEQPTSEPPAPTTEPTPPTTDEPATTDEPTPPDIDNPLEQLPDPEVTP